MLILVLFLSMALRLGAAVLALWLAGGRGRRRGWIAVAAGLAVFALEPAVALAKLAAGEVPVGEPPAAAWFGLGASALLFFGFLGVVWVRARAADANGGVGGGSVEREALFRALAESVPDAVVLADGAGRIVYWNRGAEAIFGYPAAEVVGKAVEVLIPERDLEAHRAGLGRAGKRGEGPLVGRTVQLHGVRRDGTEVPVELSLGTWGAGEERYYVAVIRDMTARLYAEQALRRMNRALRSVLHCHEALARASDEVAAAREICRILVEDAGYRLVWVGFSGEDRVVRPVASWGDEGYPPAGVITAEEMELGGGPTGTALGTGQPVVCRDVASDLRFVSWREEALRRGFRSAAAFPLKVGQEPVGSLTVYSGEADAFDEAEVELLAALARDLAQATWAHRVRTDREILEAQLRHAQKMEALGEVSAGIAHDLRNVLTVILTSAELLRERVAAGDAEARSAVADLEAAARSGAELTRKLLAFGRPEELVLRPLDVSRHVREFTGTLRRVLPEFVRLEVVAPADGLPPVLADQGALEQILLNLATNSRDAMPEGGTLRIVVGAVRFYPEDRAVHGGVQAGEYVCVSVSDTGIGMDAATLERVFEPFFTTKRDRGGTGLGLAVVYGLVRQHGGFIRGYSEPGVGTTFKLYLPVAPPREGTAAVEVQRPAVAGGRETVLVAEDDPALRRAAQRALERFGYRVLLAGDGDEAVRILREQGDAVDLVLADMVMPGMGGAELLRVARAESIAVPFVFVSGHTREGVLERAGLDPDVPFIEKPWSVEELALQVRAVLDRAKGR